MDKQYDLICQPGSQVKFLGSGMHGDCYELAEHTMLRTKASAIAYKKGITPYLATLGGSNFGVRYDDQTVFGANHPTQKSPIFTFEAFASSDYYRKSEAAVIKDVLVKKFGIPTTKVFAETLSATTEENAAFLATILKRRPDPKSPKGILGVDVGSERIGLLTLLYHMERALPIFRKAGLNVEPIFAENILVDDDPKQLEVICNYYASPKGGKQYPVDYLHSLLTSGKTLNELWTINPRRNPYDIAEENNDVFEETLMSYLGAKTMDEAVQWLREWQLINPPK